MIPAKRLTSILTITVGMAILLSATNYVGADDAWTGALVMPTKNGLKSSFSLTLVLEANADSIRVVKGTGSEWISKNDAVLLKDAIRYYTSLISAADDNQHFALSYLPWPKHFQPIVWPA